MMNNQMNQIQFNKTFSGDDFVGIKYNKDNISIYLPLGYNPSIIEQMDDKEKKINILLLLRSIGLIKGKKNFDANFDNSTGDNKEIPFNSFWWIISDYITNGIFQDIEKEYKQGINSGKINWKRTLNSEHYFTKNRVVFTNPYYETKQQINDLISELNIYCINKSIDYVGFLLGNIKKLDSSLTDDIVNKYKKYYVNIINKELMKSFNDRKKMMLNHMKRIILMSYSSSGDVRLDYGTNSYEYVWEKMVNDTFGSGNIDISDFFPEAYWTISIFNDTRKKDSSKLRPDAILKDDINNKMYILDAKYYKFGITKKRSDLPHTDSIQKQITYGDHIIANKSKYNDIDPNNVYNAFILPYDKNDIENENYKLSHSIEFCGFAESDWKEHKFENSYERIALILVDYKYLLDCYYKKEKLVIKNLIDNIEKINSYK